jgi:reactive intermediate/imine deaminase
MRKTIITTGEAPAAIGPYSQAIRAGGLVFLSGQIPLDPETMELASPEFAGQVRQVFSNLDAVARAAGGCLDDVLKVNVYLTDLSNFQAVNELMEEVFTEPYPARAAVGVADLPRGAAVEVEAVMAITNDL